jgi:hypothetical protein
VSNPQERVELDPNDFAWRNRGLGFGTPSHCFICSPSMGKATLLILKERITYKQNKLKMGEQTLIKFDRNFKMNEKSL